MFKFVREWGNAEKKVKVTNLFTNTELADTHPNELKWHQKLQNIKFGLIMVYDSFC
jgi:hypothetical protein